MLATWILGGLGQVLAPDPNYKEDPDAVETPSSFWQMVAPDPNFTDDDTNKTVSFASPISAKRRQDVDTTSPQQQLCVQCSKKIQNPFRTPSPSIRRRETQSAPAKYESIFSPRPKENTAHHTDDLVYKVFEAARGLASAEQQSSIDTVRKFFSLLSSTAPKINLTTLKRILERQPEYIYLRSPGRTAACPPGYTPLMAAVHVGRLSAVEAVWDVVRNETQGVVDYLAQTDILGRNVFHVAALHGRADVTAWLYGLLQDDPETLKEMTTAHDLEGFTPLGLALTSPKAVARQTARMDVWDPNIMGTSLPVRYRILGMHSATIGLSERPGRRIRNEDYTAAGLVRDEQAALLAVADGHSDQGAIARLVAEGWVGAMRDVLESTGIPSPPLSWWLLKATDVCLGLDKHVRDNKQQYRGGGAVASLCALTMDQIVVANVGDCRAILIRQKKTQEDLAEQAERQLSLRESPEAKEEGGEPDLLDKLEIIELSTDHKPSVKEEADRAVAAGLSILEESYKNEAGETVSIHKIQLTEEGSDRVAFSRSFGDFEYKAKTELDPSAQAVIAVPEVRVHKRSDQDIFLIIACDGIWDVYSNEGVAQFIMRHSHEDPATIGDLLLQSCLEDKNARDNLSVAVVAFGDARAAAMAPDFLAESPKGSAKKQLFSDDTPRTYEL